MGVTSMVGGAVKLTMRDTFPEILQRLRNQKGWSGERLAEEAGLSQGLVSKYENGERKPKRDTIIRIARALGVPSDEMLLACGFLTEEQARTAPTVMEYPFGKLMLPGGGSVGLTEEQLTYLLGFYQGQGLHTQALQVLEALKYVRSQTTDNKRDSMSVEFSLLVNERNN